MSEKINLKKYELANKWIHLQNRKVSILKSLEKRGFRNVIVYGASDFALRLMEQCENEQIMKIIAISDKAIKKKGEYYKNIPLVPIDDIQDLIGDDTCVVVAAMGFHEEIVNDFRSRGITEFTLLSDLIYDAYQDLSCTLGNIVVR